MRSSGVTKGGNVAGTGLMGAIGAVALPAQVGQLLASDNTERCYFGAAWASSSRLRSGMSCRMRHLNEPSI